MTSLPHELLAREVQFVAVRSRGPGGQNVNKVSSAALLYWDFQSSSLLNEHQKLLLRLKLDSAINKEGQIYLRSDEFRDLEENKRRCLEKLALMIRQALHRPKKRVATKPTKASKLRRQKAKTRRSEIKSWRGKVRE